MSQSPTSSASAYDNRSQGIRRARSSYRQASHDVASMSTDDDLVVIPDDA